MNCICVFRLILPYGVCIYFVIYAWIYVTIHFLMAPCIRTSNLPCVRHEDMTLAGPITFGTQIVGFYTLLGGDLSSIRIG
jgi:hypothetical protein